MLHVTLEIIFANERELLECQKDASVVVRFRQFYRPLSIQYQALIAQEILIDVLDFDFVFKVAN